MILEGLVTTLDASGELHLAPMGPTIAAADFQQFQLRPFPTSSTYQNLRRHPEGVLHVTDDALLLARAAIGAIESAPPHQPAKVVRGWVLSGACRAYEFRVATIDESGERVRMEAQVVHVERMRDFLGFNRAKHAIVEAAILATRVGILPDETIRDDFARLRAPVEKTGGPEERFAYDLLARHIAAKLGGSP